MIAVPVPTEQVVTTSLLAAWLSTVRFSKTLWTDLQGCDVTFELADDLLHQSAMHPKEQDRLLLYGKASEALKDWALLLEEIQRRAWRKDSRPLAPEHARTIATGLRISVFLQTGSGKEFAAWLRERKDGAR